MNKPNLNTAFTKVELEATTYRPKHVNSVRLVKALASCRYPNRLAISRDLIRELGLQPNDRFDLLEADGVFALEKSTVGLLTLSKDYQITNASLSLHLRAKTHGCLDYDAICDDGRIVFWPKEKEE